MEEEGGKEARKVEGRNDVGKEARIKRTEEWLQKGMKEENGWRLGKKKKRKEGALGLGGDRWILMG